MTNILSRIIRRFYRRFHYYEAGLHNRYQKSDYIENIDIDIIEKIKKEYPEEFADRKYNIFRERHLSEDNFGFVLVIEGEVVSYAWMGRKEFYEGSSGYCSKLPEDTVYLYDIYTFRKFREKGYMKALVESILHIFGAKGYKKVRTIVALDNVGSNALMKKFGFKPIGLISLIKLNKKRRTSFKGL